MPRINFTHTDFDIFSSWTSVCQQWPGGKLPERTWGRNLERNQTLKGTYPHLGDTGSYRYRALLFYNCVIGSKNWAVRNFLIACDIGSLLCWRHQLSRAHSLIMRTDGFQRAFDWMQTGACHFLEMIKTKSKDIYKYVHIYIYIYSIVIWSIHQLNWFSEAKWLIFKTISKTSHGNHCCCWPQPVSYNSDARCLCISPSHHHHHTTSKVFVLFSVDLGT